MLKGNGYQENNISKIFKTISNNHSLSQSQQQTQATYIEGEEIRLSINLPYGEGTSGKLWRILRSHKIRSTFYSESTCKSNCKPDCKPKDRLAKEYKNIIVYKINCSNSEAIYFGVSKLSLKSRSDELKRSVENCDCEKSETSKHCWEADHNFSLDFNYTSFEESYSS